ncbi:hypothetical protein GN958_ATG12644 [Phytophthora infestans]|uniref:Uncharacterized protein n=1 Tax=Phytophthora infestans TaxID=4787 RepID=A0A8S9UBX6_PHYIN|nr:hypothetical protein GN958_ATG12644 [Phytophthora infestans]
MLTRSMREFDYHGDQTPRQAHVQVFLPGNSDTMIITDAKTERRLETSSCWGIDPSWDVHDVLEDTGITKTAHEVLYLFDREYGSDSHLNQLTERRCATTQRT